MNAYADTGFLISLHSADANTSRAIAGINERLFPLVWTWLHELEFRNAMRLRTFRKEIKPAEIQQVFSKVALRLNEGFYESTTPSFTEVSNEAEKLSEHYSEKLGTRSLDILHVAHAVVLGAKEFLTFDHRQAALAKAAGLKVPKL